MTENLPTPIPMHTTPPATRPAGDTRMPDASARQAAQALEASFLAEMLKNTGLGDAAAGQQGGIGAAQFASFQRNALADSMVRSGGIGLAEAVYDAIVERTDER